MSRVIKFRAWDPIRDEMYQGYDCFNPVPQGYVELQVMQFTGLTDKNGVDIYESDVIAFGDDEFDSMCGMYGEHGVVIYNECGFSVELFESNRIVRLDDHNMFSDGITCRKVIGNIHQDADLIKAKV